MDEPHDDPTRPETFGSPPAGTEVPVGGDARSPGERPPPPGDLLEPLASERAETHPGDDEAPQDDLDAPLDVEAAGAYPSDGEDSRDGEAPVDEEPLDETSASAERQPSAVWAWVRVIGGAVLVAVMLRAFVFEAFRIPSESMEDTLLIGDFVFVSKLAYGPRLFGHRLPGLSAPERGDVAVFHYPPGLEPRVEDRMPYIKRVVGLPGDTVRIVSKRVVVNREPVETPPLGRRYWTLYTDGPPPTAEAFAAAGVPVEPQRLAPGLWLVDANPVDAERLAGVEGVNEVTPFARPPDDGSAAFPNSQRYSLDDYGPLVVPRRGVTIRLDDDTYSVYRVAILRDEGHDIERTATGFAVDGRPTESYTFEQDYLFVLGDHRDDSADSRTWGFVPTRNLIGRAALVYLSWDAEARQVRWNRIGMRVR